MRRVGAADFSDDRSPTAHDVDCSVGRVARRRQYSIIRYSSEAARTAASRVRSVPETMAQYPSFAQADPIPNRTFMPPRFLPQPALCPSILVAGDLRHLLHHGEGLPNMHFSPNPSFLP